MPKLFSSPGGLVLAARPMATTLLATMLLAGSAEARQVEMLSLKDVTGDDVGPGQYVYPTDEDYAEGSFDLQGMTLTITGDRATFEVSFAQPLRDPWGMGAGFSLQTVFIFLDQREGGHLEAPPGLNVHFAEGSGWELCLMLSPQQPARLRRTLERLSMPLGHNILLPERTVGRGSTITAQVPLEALGEGDLASWGYQVVVLATDNLPPPGLLFTRRIETEQSRHEFGGSRGTCAPNTLDVLGGTEQLTYECRSDGTARNPATLSMVPSGLNRVPSATPFRERQELLSQGRSQDPRP